MNYRFQFSAILFCYIINKHLFLKKTENGWREVLIDIDPNVSDGSRKLRYVLSNGPTPGTKLYTSVSMHLSCNVK